MWRTDAGHSHLVRISDFSFIPEIFSVKLVLLKPLLTLWHWYWLTDGQRDRKPDRHAGRTGNSGGGLGRRVQMGTNLVSQSLKGLGEEGKEAMVVGMRGSDCLCLPSCYWMCKILWLSHTTGGTHCTTLLFVRNFHCRKFHCHYRLWLSSPFTDSPGDQAFIYSGFSNIKQLVQVHPCIPDCLGDRPNILLPLRFIAMTVDSDSLNSHCRSVLPSLRIACHTDKVTLSHTFAVQLQWFWTCLL